MISREEFYKHLEIAEKTRDPEAQYKVGKYYLEQKQESYAKDWFKKSAEQDYAAAQFEMAKLCLSSSYTRDNDFIEAAEWCLKAAEQKHSEAQILLKKDGDLYKKLNEIARSSYFSSETGRAAYLLAKAHLSRHLSMKDVEKSLAYYEKAVKCRHVEAANELGDIYYHGKIVTKDYGKAYNDPRHLDHPKAKI